MPLHVYIHKYVCMCVFYMHFMLHKLTLVWVWGPTNRLNSRLVCCTQSICSTWAKNSNFLTVNSLWSVECGVGWWVRLAVSELSRKINKEVERKYAYKKNFFCIFRIVFKIYCFFVLTVVATYVCMCVSVMCVCALVREVPMFTL